jgi:hypothetical protein
VEDGKTNVRWDAVAKGNTYWSSRRRPEDSAPAPRPRETGEPVDVQVWLFGRMANPEVGNPLPLRLAAGCAVRDVISELGRRLGPDFLRSVLSESGESFNTCRVFLEGEPAGDMDAPIPRVSAATTVEIILFREIEGG